MELFPVAAKKIASGGDKIPCPSGTGNLLQTIAPEHEMAFESPIAEAIRKTSLQKYPAGREQRLPAGRRSFRTLFRGDDTAVIQNDREPL
jgi:hypothetical protein